MGCSHSQVNANDGMRDIRQQQADPTDHILTRISLSKTEHMIPSMRYDPAATLKMLNKKAADEKTCDDPDRKTELWEVWTLTQTDRERCRRMFKPGRSQSRRPLVKKFVEVHAASQFRMASGI